MDSKENDTPYGFCPKCGGKGVFRERRFDGNDECENSCRYKSVDAICKDKSIDWKSNYEAIAKIEAAHRAVIEAQNSEITELKLLSERWEKVAKKFSEQLYEVAKLSVDILSNPRYESESKKIRDEFFEILKGL